MSDPDVLSTEKCLELLRGAIVGRVAFTVSEGPRIVPVNYTTVDEAIVFRTTPDSLLGRHAQEPLAFEIDHVDYADHKGWSVLATGRGERVEDTEELSRIRRTWDPAPWAGGARPLYVKLAWDELTGRRLGQGWTHENETPVRRHL